MNSNRTIPSGTSANYQQMSLAELTAMRCDKLVEICSLYGRSVSGNKTDLIACVKEGPATQVTLTIVEKMLQLWFMKPSKKTPALKLGTVNEASSERAEKVLV